MFALYAGSSRLHARNCPADSGTNHKSTLSKLNDDSPYFSTSASSQDLYYFSSIRAYTHTIRDSISMHSKKKSRVHHTIVKLSIITVQFRDNSTLLRPQ